MIRNKHPAVDLKRSYRTVLMLSVGLSALLHAGFFGLVPMLHLDPRVRPLAPVVIELEQIPATQQRIPPRLREPLQQMVRAPAILAPPPREVTPPEVVTEFALEQDEEAVEFWMLERQPQVLRRVVPEYPDSARATFTEGRVYVRILLGTDGRVERVGHVTGPGIFHRTATQAAREWQFTPAIQNEKPVKVWVSVPFIFRLEAPGER